PVSELAGDRAEDPGATRVALVIDQDGRVLVEPDVAAVGAAVFLGRPDDDRPDDVALLDGGVRDGLLDAGDDHVADAGRGLERAAHDPDALDRAGARVVGDAEAGLRLDHAGASPVGSAASAASSPSGAWRPGWAAAWIASSVSTSSTMMSDGLPCSPARWTTLTSFQRLVAERGRDSSMMTVSPVCASFSSS